MSLAFHLVHPDMVEALMLFDTGPGFRNADARRAWNERAEQRARDLEARGLAALGEGDEGPASIARHAVSPGRRAAAGPGRRPYHRRARQDHGADPGIGRCRRHAFSCRRRLHGAQDPSWDAGDDPQRWPRVQPASTGRLQPRRHAVSWRTTGRDVIAGAGIGWPDDNHARCPLPSPIA